MAVTLPQVTDIHLSHVRACAPPHPSATSLATATVTGAAGVSGNLSAGSIGAPSSAPSQAPEAGSLEELRAIARRCQALAAGTWPEQAPVEAKEALVVLETITRTLTSVRVGILGQIERTKSWSDDGERTLTSWVTNRTGTSRGSAAKEVGLAQALSEELPHTREALARGDISADHAHVIAREAAKSDALRTWLKDPTIGEAHLVEQAQRMNATDFAKEAKKWATQHDPKGADRQWRKNLKKEQLHLVPFDHGTRITGWFTTANGALLAKALESHMGRKGADDTRQYPERHAAALMSMANQSLNSGLQLPSARIRPQLTITVDYTTLAALINATASSMPAGASGRSGVSEPGAWAATWHPDDDHVIATSLDYSRLVGAAPATLPDGSPLAPSELARLACSSTLNRVIFGPDSTILDSGRDERIFTAAQTRAIIARDRHCQYPGCVDSPNTCEVHHSLEWYKHNGATDANLGILLCWHHHTLVHAREITITRRRGAWIFNRKNGQLIRSPGGPPDDRPSGPPGDPPGGPYDNARGHRAPDFGSSGTAPPKARPAGTAPPNARPSRINAPTLWEPDPHQDPNPPF